MFFSTTSEKYFISRLILQYLGKMKLDYIHKHQIWRGHFRHNSKTIRVLVIMLLLLENAKYQRDLQFMTHLAMVDSRAPRDVFTIHDIRSDVQILGTEGRI